MQRSGVRYNRQADLIKCNMDTRIMVVGAGGIGSFTVLTLAKMGFQTLYVFDDDRVDTHNLPNQFYRNGDVGAFKVHALYDIVAQFSETKIRTADARADVQALDDLQPEVLISAVDNMEARRMMYEWQRAHTDRCKLFVDGRMGGDQAEVYVVRDDDSARLYETRLWYDAETTPVPCTSKATMYNVLTIASMLANNVRLALAGEATIPGIIVDNFNMKMHYVKE